MTCAACGFEGLYFIPLVGVTASPLDNGTSTFSSNMPKGWDPDFREIWACPKCGTIKVELEELEDEE